MGGRAGSLTGTWATAHPSTSSTGTSSESLKVPTCASTLSPSRSLTRTCAGGLVLHLGCGTSDLSVALAREAPHARVVNADFSEECLRIMRQRHPGA